MTNGRIVFTMLAFLAGLMPGCDRGLGPITEETGFSGVITFKNWPPPEKVLELRLVAFEEFPADSSNLVQALLEMRAAYQYKEELLQWVLEEMENYMVEIQQMVQVEM